MPRRDVDRLHEEIEELFAELWQVPRFPGLHRGFRPNVDAYLCDDPRRLVVVIELPGVDPESLQLVVGERVLAIVGERPRPQAEGRVYEQMEIEYGPFRRQIRLPEDVDPDGAHARYEHGIVTVTLPVAAKPQTGGRIAIEVEPG